MQAGARFIQDIERVAGAAFREFARQLDTLRFAARKRRRWLTKADVVETDINHGL